MSFSYEVFGLRLRSSVSIPGLNKLLSCADPDVEIHLAPRDETKFDFDLEDDRRPTYVSPNLDERGRPVLQVWRLKAGGGLRLLYADATQFVVRRQGAHIDGSWVPPSTLADTATYLLGPILGLALRLRGMVCLHASAVVIRDRAVAFLGPAGAGKSTTVAAFARQGFPVLTDDVVAVRDGGGEFLAHPGAPQVCLWPDSVGLLFDSPDALPRLTPTWDKRHLDLNRPDLRFHASALPLGAVYWLGERVATRRPVIQEVSATASLLALVANTYVNYLLDREMRAREFELLGRLRARVPVRQILASADAATFPALCEAVVADFDAQQKALE